MIDPHKSPTTSQVSTAELFSYLDWLQRFLEETEHSLGALVSAPEIRISIPLLRDHLDGRAETPTSLMERSNLSRGTAHRTINAMIKKGDIIRRERTRSGKTFTLHPSNSFLARWLNLVASTRLTTSNINPDNFGNEGAYSGSTYLVNSTIPPLGVLDDSLSLKGGLKILLHSDPVFLAMTQVKRQFELHFGAKLSAHAQTIDKLHDSILKNSDLDRSLYDIVTCDVCWMAEFIERGIVLPLFETPTKTPSDLEDFHHSSLSTVTRGNIVYGLPVQTTPELLIYRKDLLSQLELPIPETPQELIDTARALQNIKDNVSGISWNGAAGTPIGTTFLMLLADFGRPLVKADAAARMASSNQPARLLAENIDLGAGVDVIEFMNELLQFSPPTVLQMSWYERSKCFAEGQAAMAFCYTQSVQLFENDSTSPAYRNTGYALHPNVNRSARIAPLGGWNLCIPSNLESKRIEDVRQAITSFCSAPASKLYIEHGSMVSSRFSVCDDPYVAYNHPVIPTVDEFEKNHRIQLWPRPQILQLSRIVQLLGHEVHECLKRNQSPHKTLASMQRKIHELIKTP